MYDGKNSLSTSTPSFDFGRSRTWPTDAVTSKPEPRMPEIVRALAGDSTMTSSRVRPRRGVVPLVSSATAAAALRVREVVFVVLDGVFLAGICIGTIQSSLSY